VSVGDLQDLGRITRRYPNIIHKLYPSQAKVSCQKMVLFLLKYFLFFCPDRPERAVFYSLRVFHGKPNAAQHPHRMGQVEMNG
jgi:hypothetical protein